MNVLILGGTKFLGVHLVDALLGRSHTVTLFNRGQSGRTPDGVEHIRGDRDEGLAALGGRAWDAVIDTCGFVPRIVRASAAMLAPVTGLYAFVSSISAYADPLGGNLDENEPVGTIPDESVEEITGDTYGPLKALCEREVERAMHGTSLVVRPGLIVGPLDPTDRFTYWPNRFALGGDVLVPAGPTRVVSVIDVRDLAKWIVRAVERNVTGTFNAAGEPEKTTMGTLVDACQAAAGVPARPVWLSETFLMERAVTPWSDLPLWLPSGSDSIVRAGSAKAQANGLTRRPLAETVGDTLDWTRSMGLERPLHAGLTREREAELLAAWSATRARPL